VGRARNVRKPRPTTWFNLRNNPKENKRQELRIDEEREKQRQKGDAEIRMGTFLMGLDTNTSRGAGKKATGCILWQRRDAKMKIRAPG
jgi:hypothetical protein